MTTEELIEAALRDAETELRRRPEFTTRAIAGNGSVVGARGPDILSEGDAVLLLVRSLLARGVEWRDVHLELTLSRWLWSRELLAEAPSKSSVDLALVPQRTLIEADLPATVPGAFSFSAFLEVKYASDFWKHGRTYGHPTKKREEFVKDVDKCLKYLEAELCTTAWAVLFEECDHELPADFRESNEKRHPGLRVRIVRSWGPDQ